jgi:hypothetical protein
MGAALTVLLGGLLAPHLRLAGSGGRWYLPGGLCAASVVLFLVAGAKGFDAGHPRPDTLSYGLDADANRAYWLSSDRTPDAYTSRYLGATPARAPLPEFPPLRGRAMLQAPAPPKPLAPTMVELTASKTERELRVVQLSVRPQRPVNLLYLYIDPGAELSKVSVDGSPLELIPERRGASSQPVLALGGLPKKGAEVQLWLRGGVSPLWLLAIDWAYGVEAAPRPAGFMPHPFNPDMTLVRKTYKFK